MNKWKTLLIGSLAGLLLVGCAEAELEAQEKQEVQEAPVEEIAKNTLYEQLYEQTEFSENSGLNDIEIYYNKKNGCIKEFTKVRTGHGLGLSESYALDENGQILCGLTIEEAKAYYKP